MKKIIIAIDGYSSCGKSTLAKQLAKQLSYLYIDSGAMYRAITLYFLRNQTDLSDKNQVTDALNHIELRFMTNSETGFSEIYLNGENVESLIRELGVAEKVSDVAALKEVREFAVAQQREMGISKGIVMDGRDIGTTVFPEAELKIFMTADKEVRAQRRFLEMQLKDPNADLQKVKANLLQRDTIDSTREISPLQEAKDARVLDNSDLTHEEQLQVALQWAHEKLKP